MYFLFSIVKNIMILITKLLPQLFHFYISSTTSSIFLYTSKTKTSTTIINNTPPSPLLITVITTTTTTIIPLKSFSSFYHYYSKPRPDPLNPLTNSLCVRNPLLVTSKQSNTSSNCSMLRGNSAWSGVVVKIGWFVKKGLL